MLPGKKYTPEDLIALVKRRFWILLVPLAVVAAGTAVWARTLPDRFRSEATILVVPPQVPEAYVKSAVTTRIEDRVQSASQQILSRTRLERLIEDLGLYVQERRTNIMEDVVNWMRTKDIHVEVVKGDAFTVSYVGSVPRTVQKVASSLASLYIDENLKDRELLAEGTNQFLEVQLEDARRRLVEKEKALEDYRMRFAGQLPSQLTANLQALQSTQTQIQATLEAINHDRDQQFLIQKQLADLQAEVAAAADAPPAAAPTQPTSENPGAPAVGTTEQQLAAARNTLAALEMRYKADYPDIPRVKRMIQDLQQKLDAEALTQPVSGSTSAAVSPMVAARQKRIDDLKLALDAVAQRITTNQENEKRLRTFASDYQKKIDQVPERESQMTELTRDYGTLQTMYTTLLTKKEESNISANLERRQIGEQFKLLDPAPVPEKPISPNRPGIISSGMAAGLGIGLALIVLLEYRDASFKTDEEVTSILSLPVLAVVPVMRSDRDKRRELKRKILVNAVLASTVLGCAAVVAYTFLRPVVH